MLDGPGEDGPGEFSKENSSGSIEGAGETGNKIEGGREEEGPGDDSDSTLPLGSDNATRSTT